MLLLSSELVNSLSRLSDSFSVSFVISAYGLGKPGSNSSGVIPSVQVFASFLKALHVSTIFACIVIKRPIASRSTSASEQAPGSPPSHLLSSLLRSLLCLFIILNKASVFAQCASAIACRVQHKIAAFIIVGILSYHNSKSHSSPGSPSNGCTHSSHICSFVGLAVQKSLMALSMHLLYARSIAFKDCLKVLSTPLVILASFKLLDLLGTDTMPLTISGVRNSPFSSA